MNCHHAPLSATIGVRENASMKAPPYIISAAKTAALIIIRVNVTRITRLKAFLHKYVMDAFHPTSHIGLVYIGFWRKNKK
jgi:hypothetical protein